MTKTFNRFSEQVSLGSGSPFAFIAAVTMITVWIISGPIFDFSETWQLIINTTTTIITFLMVFVIQNTQNRNESAMQAKLDELIRAVEKADNSLIGSEHVNG